MTTEKTRVSQIPVGATLDFDAHTGCTVFYADSLTKPYGEWERVTGVHDVLDRQDSTSQSASSNGSRGSFASRNRVVTLLLDQRAGHRDGRTVQASGGEPAMITVTAESKTFFQKEWQVESWAECEKDALALCARTLWDEIADPNVRRRITIESPEGGVLRLLNRP